MAYFHLVILRQGSKCKCFAAFSLSRRDKKLDSNLHTVATVTRYFCLHFTSVVLSRYVCSYTPFFSKDVVFPAQAEYSYFSADFRLKIFLYYSYIRIY